MNNLVLVLAVSFVASTIAVPLARRLALRRGILDVPNERSSHRVPTPRIGGVGILIGTIIGLAVAWLVSSNTPEVSFWALVLSLLAGSAVGFLDDLFQMPTILRLPLYLVSAVAISIFFGYVSVIALPGIPALNIGLVGGVLFSSLFVAWYTNLFNFMDGIDGIAGGAALVTLGALAIAFFSSGSSTLGFLAASAAAGTTGFLLFNYPPASVFMGDGGSVFLGMTAGALSLAAVAEKTLSLAAAIFLMMPFVFDATFTLFRRILKREPVWQAHRSHIYQQMCDLGLTHGQITIIYSVAGVFFAAVGLFFDRMPALAQVLVWWSSLLVLLMLGLFVVVRNQRRNHHEAL